MAKLSKKSRHPKAPAPARDSRGAATQVRGSAVAIIGVADRPALGRAYLAHRKTHGSAAAGDDRRTLESLEIDPPAGFVRSRIARISPAIIVAHTMTMGGKLRWRTRPPSRLRAGLNSRAGAAATVDESRRGEVDAKFSASQLLEITQNRERIPETPSPGVKRARGR